MYETLHNNQRSRQRGITNQMKALPAKYFMVEGWQSKPWQYGNIKYFSVELTAPYSLSTLTVNVRGVL